MRSCHYCLVKNSEYLPLDKSTAKLAVGWLQRTNQPYVLERRRTKFGRPAIDIVIQDGKALLAHLNARRLRETIQQQPHRVIRVKNPNDVTECANALLLDLQRRSA